MGRKAQIISLKSIKVGFDAIFVLLILSVLILLIVSIPSLIMTTPDHPSYIPATIIEKELEANKLVEIVAKHNGSKVGSMFNKHEVYIEVGQEETNSRFTLYRLVYMFALALGVLFICFIVFHIRNIIKSIIKGMKEEDSRTGIKHHIFNTKNINRFRYIAYGFIIMPIIELSIYFFNNFYLNKYFYISGKKIEPISNLLSVSWDYFFIGLLFIALIEVLRKGMKIQEENDLTV